MCERLTDHGGIDATDIDVSVDNGEVTLKGTVDSRYAKRKAEDLAEAVKGVRDVHNQLRVQDRDEDDAGATGARASTTGAGSKKTTSGASRTGTGSSKKKTTASKKSSPSKASSATTSAETATSGAGSSNASAGGTGSTSG